MLTKNSDWLRLGYGWLRFRNLVIDSTNSTDSMARLTLEKIVQKTYGDRLLAKELSYLFLNDI